MGDRINEMEDRTPQGYGCGEQSHTLSGVAGTVCNAIRNIDYSAGINGMEDRRK
jgi:hypothetical protein